MQVTAELVATVHTRYVFQGLADFHFFGSRRQPISPLLAYGPHPVGVQPEPLMTTPAQFSRVDVPLNYGYKQLVISSAGGLLLCVGSVPAVVVLGLWQCVALPPRHPAMQPYQASQASLKGILQHFFFTCLTGSAWQQHHHRADFSGLTGNWIL